MHHLLQLQSQLIGMAKTGSMSCPEADTLEQQILASQALRELVRTRIHDRRGIENSWEPNHNHIHGIPEVIRITKNSGGHRNTFAPEDADYLHGTTFLIGIITPITEGLLGQATHGFRPRRGTDTAIIAVLQAVHDETQKDLTIIREDIEDCFPNMPIETVIEAFPTQTKQTILNIQRRYQEAAARFRIRPRGLPQGHPTAPAITNLVIDKIVKPVCTRFEGRARLVAYCDDLTIIGDRRSATMMRENIREALDTYGVKFNPRKARSMPPTTGNHLHLLGYDIEWPRAGAKPNIGPIRTAYDRLSEKITEAQDITRIRQIIKGWKQHYDGFCNDPRHLDRTQDAVNEGYKRWIRQHTQHPTRPR